MRFFKVVLASALGYFLAAVLMIGLMMAVIGSIAGSSKPKVDVPETSVLNLKLNALQNDREQSSDPFQALEALDPSASMPIGLNDVLRCIDKAKSDDNIKGIVLDLTTLQAGYSKLTEIRDQLEDFKTSGKFIYAYADFYYYQTYYLASVADSIYVNPKGQMAFNGMVAEIAFFSNTLKKLGIEMQVIREGKFKGAVEPYTRESLSEDNRHQISEYINSIFDETLGRISKSRNIPIDTLKRDADELKLRSVNDFNQHGYLDVVAYRDQFYNDMKTRMGIDTEKKVALLSEQKYIKSAGAMGSGSDRIAVIYASGDIVSGKGDGTQIAAEDMTATLKKVRESDKIKAVVLRIDSRGGSSLASDIIWREVKLLAEEKPLIVSMSDVAASGGYYIATPAKKIVAEPTSITGSIGVFGLIPNAKELLNDKLGLNLEYVGTGKNSDLGRIDQSLSVEGKAYIEEIIDEIYQTFIQRVSEGRNMTLEEVDEVAQGRVWTGKAAAEVGLVDELGGLDLAIQLAATEAGIEEYKIREYPSKNDPFSIMFKKLQSSSALESHLKETSFGKYVQYLQQFEQWGSKHSVQMLMPYDIKISNYHLQ